MRGVRGGICGEGGSVRGGGGSGHRVFQWDRRLQTLHKYKSPLSKPGATNPVSQWHASIMEAPPTWLLKVSSSEGLGEQGDCPRWWW